MEEETLWENKINKDNDVVYILWIYYELINALCKISNNYNIVILDYLA